VPFRLGNGQDVVSEAFSIKACFPIGSLDEWLLGSAQASVITAKSRHWCFGPNNLLSCAHVT
jgi:hypothetical protein